VQLDQREFERSLPRIVASLEEPIAASSIVPMYFVSQRARQDVKVALIGQGPDELFGGYKRHLGVRYGEYWRKLPAALQALARAAVTRLPRNEMVKRGVASLGTHDRLTRHAASRMRSAAPACCRPAPVTPRARRGRDTPRK
jgi:asparagine synthase (glutamine-hydrolysing)